MSERELDGLIVDDSERCIFRVHRSTMISDEILRLERERIFAAVWLYLGHESEIRRPGDYVRRSVGGRPLIFARGKNGTINGFYNTCTHRGATICRQDSGNAKSLQCFYHAWTFDLDGNLTGVPDAQAYGPGFDRDALGLRRVARLESYRGFVFVSFNPEVEPLSEYLAGARRYIDLVVDSADGELEIIAGSNQYTIQANWKLLAENSFDGYHGLPTHETYFTYIAGLEEDARRKIGDLSPSGAAKSYLTTGRGRDLGNGHGLTQKVAPWGRPIAKWSALFGAEAKPKIEALHRQLVEKYGDERAFEMADTSRNMVIFPNFVLNDIMAITARTFTPVSPGIMRVSAWQLAPVNESPEMRAARLDNFLTFLGPGGFATPDDVEALESCQQGFAATEVEWSDISRGMNLDEPRPLDELQMRTWWRRWRELMTGRVPAMAR
ncbi:MAG: p-cumate dioxygenase [Candidatus Eremiobacteraeota bacterium]|nr:p-cumate dioxygenase [Candidatus Eremiobacteraeota bacterium]